MRSSSGGKNVPRMLVFDPAGGMSGDMFLGCLFGLGVRPAQVVKEVSTLPGLEPFRIISGRVKRRGLSAVRVRVSCRQKAASRDLAGILGMIEKSRLDDRVKEISCGLFRLLGEAEGKVHGVEASGVHFHEVGAVDSIVDIVGGVVALSILGYPALYHRPFRLGCGIISISHGELPLPAPATIELLKGRRVTMSSTEGEIVTPTGAALMKGLAAEMPAGLTFRPGRIVYAAGTRDKGPEPGMLRVVEGFEAPLGRRLAVIRSTIDDMNPEIYGYLLERLFGEGALEVYLTQVLMKKNRPGQLLTVLCEPERAEALSGLIFEETTTLGLRIGFEDRTELERWNEKVMTGYGGVTVKCGRLPGGRVKVSPEFESCRAVAVERGVAVNLVYTAARCAARTGTEGPEAKKRRRKKR